MSGEYNPISATIHSSGLVDISTEQNHMVVKKTISLTDFIRIINTNDVGDRESILLPLGIVKFFESGQRFVAIIRVNEHVRTDSSFGRGDNVHKFEALPVPFGYLIVIYSKLSKSVYKAHFIADTPFSGPLDLDSKKYMAWPFNNYSSSYGTGVCWGSGSPISQIKEIHNLDRLIDIYFQSPFNGDLDGRFSNEWVKTQLESSGIERKGDIDIYIALEDFYKKNGIFPYVALETSNYSINDLIKA